MGSTAMMLLLLLLFSYCHFAVSGCDDILVDDEDDDVFVENDVGVSVVVDGSAPHGK